MSDMRVSWTRPFEQFGGGVKFGVDPIKHLLNRAVVVAL